MQIIREISGKPIVLDLEYKGSDEEKKLDEVENLYDLIKEVKEKHPEINAISSGAIASTYQKLRVEDMYTYENNNHCYSLIK